MVYQGIDMETGDSVAIKLKPLSNYNISNFKREARMLTKL